LFKRVARSHEIKKSEFVMMKSHNGWHYDRSIVTGTLTKSANKYMYNATANAAPCMRSKHVKPV